MNKPTAYTKGQIVNVIGMFTGTVRNIRFDDRGEALYTIDTTETPDGMYIAREMELAAV